MTDRTEVPALTVELSGGLANQLFQWAAGYLLAEETGSAMRLDARLVNRPDGRGYQLGPMIPECDVIYPSRREQRWWIQAHQRLPRRGVGALKRARRVQMSINSRVAHDYGQARALIGNASTVRLRGLFQDVTELLPHRELLRSVLLPQLERLRPTGLPETYSAAHVRRGDYVSVPKYAKLYGSCSAEYYRSAVAILPLRLPLVMATDDRRWTSKLVSDSGWDDAAISPAEDHFGDFAVMVRATQQVLSNSTFSWWAAFLGTAQTVVAPDPWFSDTTRDRSLPLQGWHLVPRDAISA